MSNSNEEQTEARLPSLENLPESVRLAIKIESVLMPHSREERDKLFEQRRRFAHYTSADAALSIIKEKRLWLRNTTAMSDYREVNHGYDFLLSFFRNPEKKKAFVDALDSCAPGIAVEAMNIFDKWFKDIQFGSYIASISVHDDKEDLHGRLSMWRAFGGNAARVAFVLKAPYLSQAAEALQIMFSPVAYLTENEMHKRLDHAIRNIIVESEFLKTVDRAILLRFVLSVLVTFVVCVKHEGFAEEQEWRVIYSPNRFPSPLVESETKIVGTVPQIIYKLPLDGAVSPALAEMDFCRMFDRLIIGPSIYPWVMYQAFVTALKSAGVADADSRVICSGIPIRS